MEEADFKRGRPSFNLTLAIRPQMAHDAASWGRSASALRNVIVIPLALAVGLICSVIAVGIMQILDIQTLQRTMPGFVGGIVAFVFYQKFRIR